MANKEAIQLKLNLLGLKLGCYNDGLEKLSKKELNKVVENLEYGDTDVEVSIRRKKYIVEVFRVDNEVDLLLTTPEKYTATYGNNK